MENPLRSDTQSSSMRIMLLLCVLTAIVISILAVVLNRDLAATGVLVGTLIGPAFVGKGVQSFAERKEVKSGKK